MPVKGFLLLLKVGHIPITRGLLHWLCGLSRLGELDCLNILPGECSHSLQEWAVMNVQILSFTWHERVTDTITLQRRRGALSPLHIAHGIRNLCPDGANIAVYCHRTVHM